MLIVISYKCVERELTVNMSCRGYEGEAMLGQSPSTQETTCGIWFIRGPWLQKFANKKAYVFLYGLLGCIFSASYSYFNGTITTLEKRYKIPSKTTGNYHKILFFINKYITRIHQLFIYTNLFILKICYYKDQLNQLRKESKDGKSMV